MVEKNAIYFIIEEAIKKVSEYRYDNNGIDTNEIIRDLEHIQNCLAKGVYDKEN